MNDEPLLNIMTQLGAAIFSKRTCWFWVNLHVPLITAESVLPNIDKRRLPTVELQIKLLPASMVKSAPGAPLILIVEVPVLVRCQLTVTLFLKCIWANEIPELASTFTGPVAGVAPPTFVPS